jgi:hypothetical protein
MSIRRSIVLFLCTVAVVLGIAGLPNFRSSFLDNWTNVAPAEAEPVRIEEIWQQVYQKLPDLPKENQYINKESGKVSTENTLINRLIRYHIYVRGRTTNYRLDWKLTLADYLGANEKIEADTYPSGSSLRTNPLAGDTAAINRLTRTQREALVDNLVGLFTGNASDAAGASTGHPTPAPTAPSPTIAPSPAASPVPSRFPRLPQPGDAQLLKP